MSQRFSLAGRSRNGLAHRFLSGSQPGESLMWHERADEGVRAPTKSDRHLSRFLEHGMP
jgi:hypothetical protein